MIENRFPSSGLSAEYGDIIISNVTHEVILSVSHADTVILSEKYTPDSSENIIIKNIGELALLYYEPGEMLTATGEDSNEILFLISIDCDAEQETISKYVHIYPTYVDFSSTLNVELLKKIPLSRTTKKNTAPGRKEFISFWGGSTVKIYAMYMGEIVDQSITLNLVTLASNEKTYAVDVSPSVIADLINQPVSKLIYYNVYTSEDSIIQFVVSKRNWQFEKTFMFRNCFGAQETFTCTGDEISQRKWIREYGVFNSEKIDFSREMENAIDINSGYITAKDVEVIEDMLNSDDVCVIDGSGLQKVTILEEEFKDSSRKDELKSVTFKYRYSKANKLKSTYNSFKKIRVFAKTFDKKFH